MRHINEFYLLNFLLIYFQRSILNASFRYCHTSRVDKINVTVSLTISLQPARRTSDVMRFNINGSYYNYVHVLAFGTDLICPAMYGYRQTFCQNTV